MIKPIINFIHKLFEKRFIRFLFVGGINTLFGYGVFALFIFIGIHYSLASLLGLIFGILFSFKTNGSIVFKNRDNRLIFKFVAVYFVTYLTNIVILKTFHDHVSLYVVQAALMLPMGILAYILQKIFVFNVSGAKKMQTSHIKRNAILISFGLIISFFLIFKFFAVGKFSDYPWWHSTGSDGDALFAAAAVGAINDTDMNFFMHPAATLHSLNGLTYRVLSLFDNSHKELLNLKQIDTMHDAFAILETATKTSRILTLFTAVFFIFFLTFFIYCLTKHYLITFLITSYVASSYLFVLHSFWIRPEVLSLLFIFAAIYLYFVQINKEEITPRQAFFAYLTVGTLIGLSVLSKIQTGPIIIIFMAAVLLSCFINKRQQTYLTTKRIEKNNNSIALLNLFIMPWWAIRRPAFVTKDYLYSIDINIRAIYGSAPNHFYFLFLGILLSLLFISIILSLFAKRKEIKPFVICSLVLNQIICGMILSAYIVLLPITSTFGKYFTNTQSLIYSVLTNLFCGNLLQGKINFDSAIQLVVGLHNSNDKLFNMNLFYVVIIMMLLCIVRLLFKKTKLKKSYVIALLFFCSGLMMDILSGTRTLTTHGIYVYYGIYSFCLYSVGIAVCLSSEFKQKASSKWKKISLKLFHWGIILVLSLQAYSKIPHSFKISTEDALSGQAPIIQYRNTKVLANFWDLVESTLRNNSIKEQNNVPDSSFDYLKKINISQDSKEQSQLMQTDALKQLALAKKRNSNLQEKFSHIASSMETLEKAIQKDPLNIENYVLLSQVYINVGSFKGALIPMQSGLILSPQNVKLHYQLALTYYKIKDFGMARHHTNQTILFAQKQKDARHVILANKLKNDLSRITATLSP